MVSSLMQVTEGSCYGPLRDKVLYREARSLTDYVGGRNQWAGEAKGALANTNIEGDKEND